MVDGDVAGAFDRLCQDSATWRRLRARSDMLIQDMIGVAQMSNAAQLYAQILAEQPAGFAAPCPEVFASLSDDELDQCAVFRMEYLVWRNSMPQAIEGEPKLQEARDSDPVVARLLEQQGDVAGALPVSKESSETTNWVLAVVPALTVSVPAISQRSKPIPGSPDASDTSTS